MINIYQTELPEVYELVEKSYMKYFPVIVHIKFFFCYPLVHVKVFALGKGLTYYGDNFRQVWQNLLVAWIQVENLVISFFIITIILIGIE